jgi:FkbM family methyltransferase
MSEKLARLITGIAALVTSPQNKRRAAITRARAAEMLQPTWQTEIDGIALAFHCPSGAAAAAAHALHRLEPETRAWIRAHVGPGEVMWDIGANVGIYSLYAAKLKRAKVFAFEPNAGTYAVLSRNIALNGLGEQIKAMPLALSGKAGLDTFFLWRESPGHAMGALGKPENVLGAFAPEAAQSCLKMAMDDFAALPGALAPDHLKIDVDGHELEVLAGGPRCLSRVKSICIELLPESQSFSTAIAQRLRAAGFTALPRATDAHRNTVFVRAES